MSSQVRILGIAGGLQLGLQLGSGLSNDFINARLRPDPGLPPKP